MMMEIDLEIEPVFIIESPSQEDMAVGRREGKALGQALSQMGVPGKVYLVKNADGFDEAIDKIITAMKDLPEAFQIGLMPYLHISAHGHQDGFTLMSGEDILWEDLRDALNRLNEALGYVQLPGDADHSREVARFNICLSTCEGFAGARTYLNDPCPFQSLVGPNEELDWPVALVAFQVFYLHTLFHKSDIEQSVLKMNQAMNTTVSFNYVVSPEVGKLMKATDA